MPANNKHKLKLLSLIRILQSETDPEHGLSMPQIIEHLAAEGIRAERKAIYRDLQALRDVGFEVRTLRTRPVQYVLVRNELDLDDVMMLVDMVQSSRFITDRRSNQLITSLKGMVSERERELLDKRVHVQGRVKSQSESVFRNVDVVHEAMQRKLQVEFLYFSYDTEMKRCPRHEGKRYRLTPVKVAFAEGNYYLAAYDSKDEKVKTYRLDRMELLQVSEVKAVRNGTVANYEFGDTTYRTFGMFHGEPVCATLHVQAGMMDAVVDRFGYAATVVRHTPSWADVRVNIIKSPQFFGWVAGLGGGVTIKAPMKLANEYRGWLRSLLGEEPPVPEGQQPEPEGQGGGPDEASADAGEAFAEPMGERAESEERPAEAGGGADGIAPAPAQ